MSEVEKDREVIAEPSCGTMCEEPGPQSQEARYRRINAFCKGTVRRLRVYIKKKLIRGVH